MIPSTVFGLADLPNIHRLELKSYVLNADKEFWYLNTAQNQKLFNRQSCVIVQSHVMNLKHLSLQRVYIQKYIDM